MKLDDLRCRLASIAFVFIAVGSAACEPVVTFGQPPGEGGQPVTGSTSASHSIGAGYAVGLRRLGGMGIAEGCTDGQLYMCFNGNRMALDVGECKAGTQACVNGTFGECIGEVTATSEACNDLDDDCDGQVDDGNPGGGTACNTGMPGACSEGTTTCTSGAITCVPNTSGSPEVCDGIDNDCNGQLDDGDPGMGMACNTGSPGACGAGTTSCKGGAITCVPNTGGSQEVCDGIDNDCNGQIDEGNPGGGPPCVSVVGDCKEQMVTVNGTSVLLGTFVGPAGIGAPGNPGTQALPLSTIAAAQANAALIGGGADVCVCDTAAAGASVYQENVTMVEGISVIGGYNCTDWSRAISTYVTTIRGKVAFPAGITSATALDGLTVAPNDIWNSDPLQSSTAISIVNSSPSLVDVVAQGGSVPRSYGLVVSGSTASPTVTRGSYKANGVYDSGSLQVAVSLNGSSGTFTDVAIWPAGNPYYSRGLICSNCNATIVGGTISGGSSYTESQGLVVGGNSGGLSITNTFINGGGGFTSASASYGVKLNNCNGSPTLSGVQISGGSGQGSIYGVHSEGAQCAPVISGSSVNTGGALTSSSKGVTCTNNSPCVVTNSTITSAGSTNTVAAVSCDAGGCGTISGNTISVGTIDSFTVGMGIHVKNANPIVDSNHIAGPLCSSGGASGYAANFINTTALVTNNVFRDQPCNRPIDVVRIENTTLGIGPMLHNNTIQFATCNGCGVKRGLFVNGSATAGSVRNNIFVNAGTADFANGFAVYENNASSDLQFFENNALWAPNGGTLYFDEGSTSLLLADINALMGSSGNINADPLLDATFHIPMTSPCRNAGTATGAPAFDFDGEMRPQEMSYDIGADEYVP